MIECIVCYDLTNDAERSRLVKVLEVYGYRLQKSVFKFNLKKSIYLKLLEKISELKFLSEEANTLSIFFICGSCTDKTINYGRKSDFEDIVRIY